MTVEAGEEVELASPDEAALHVVGGRRSGGAEEPERIAALLRPLLGARGSSGGQGSGAYGALASGTRVRQQANQKAAAATQNWRRMLCLLQ